MFECILSLLGSSDTYIHINKHNYHLDFGFEIQFSTERSQGFLRKWLFSGHRQGKYKKSLGHFVMLESKELLLGDHDKSKEQRNLFKEPLVDISKIL